MKETLLLRLLKVLLIQKNAAHKAAAIKDGYDPATLNTRI